jgi:hypothetical protein
MRKILGLTLLTCVVLVAVVPFEPTFAASLSSPEEPPFQWRGNSWGVSSYNEYFMTNANFDRARGSFNNLPAQNTFKSFQTTLRGRFAFTSDFAAFAGIAGGYSMASDAKADKTTSGIDHALIGANYVAWQKGVRVIPEVSAGLVLSNNNVGQLTPMIGDGVNYGRLGVFVFKPFKQLILNSYAGLHIPTGGLAKRFLYQLSTEYNLSKTFALGLGINGYETVMGDSQSEADRNRTTLSGNAGSNRFWAFDPSLLEARLWVGFKPEPGMAIRLGYGNAITGIRTAEGQSVLLSFVFNSPGNSKWDEAPTKNEKPTAIRRSQKMKEKLQDFEKPVQTDKGDSFEADDADEPSPPPP